MIYGTPQVKIEDDQTDRIGIRTLILSRVWQPQGLQDNETMFIEVERQAPAPPQVPGGMIIIGAQTRPFGGAMRTVWTFEGINGDGKSVTFKTRGNSPDYGFNSGFAQVDIGLLPNIQELLVKYEGVNIDGELVFQPTLTGGTGRAAAGTAGKKNPMYSQKDFLRLDGQYFYRYAARDIAGLVVGVGKIHKGGLPGSAPVFADRDWLKAPPEYQRRGTVYDITENYWLSGPGGWVKAIYGTHNSSADASASGLTTGELTTGNL